MLKSAAILLVVFGFGFLQASNGDSPRTSLIKLVASTVQNTFNLQSASSSSSSKKFPLTPAQLQAMRKKQAATVAQERKVIEVGTIDSLLNPTENPVAF